MGKRALRTGDLVTVKEHLHTWLPMFAEPTTGFSGVTLDVFKAGIYLGGLITRASTITRQESWACVLSLGGTFGWVGRKHLARLE
jgi:hypothetical protein